MIVVDIRSRSSSIDDITGIAAVDYNNPSSQFSIAVNNNLEEAYFALLAWSSKAQNNTLAGFDIREEQTHLRNIKSRYGLLFPFNERTVDIHSIGYGKLSNRLLGSHAKNTDLSLEKLSRYVGILFEPPRCALGHATLEAEILARLLRQENILSRYAEYPVPSYLSAPAISHPKPHR